MSKTAARLFAPLAAFTNSANAYFRKSSSDRAKAQQEAKGTAKGPSGAEVDAAVAATMTKAQKEEWAKKQAEKEKEETKAEGKENGMPAAPAAAPAEAEAEAEKKVEKVEAEPVAAPVAVPAEAVVAPAAAAAATPTAIESAPAEAPKVEAEAAPAAGTTAATTGTYKLPSGATVVIPDAGTLPRDERGRRVGLEDLDDPALKEDPAILAATTAQALDGTTVDTQGKAYVDPRIYGGTSFDLVGNGEHEPLNVIISGLSSAQILTKKGFQSYLRSLDFDRECLGLHAGAKQKAWVDARGWLDQNFLYRQTYTPLDHLFGTCVESLVGGNHCRVWQQQGTGAWFLACSKEENVTQKHNIIPDGYNIGRDEFVNQSQKEKDGITSFFFTKYQTKVEWISDLMPAGAQGVNHDIPVDGRTAVLTVTLVKKSKK